MSPAVPSHPSDPEQGPVLKPLKRRLAFLAGAYGLGLSGQINLLIPLRARELGASLEAIGVIVASSSVAPVLFSVSLGALIDRFGARRSFVLGAALSGAVIAIFPLVSDYWYFLVLQFLFGLARVFGWTAAQTYVTGIGRLEDRVSYSGKFSSFSNGGAMVGPLIAGSVAQVAGLRLSFLFPALYALAFAALGLLLVDTPEEAVDGRSSRGGDRGSGLRTAVRLLAVPGIQVALLLTFVRLWVSWAWIAFFPVLLVDAGIAVGVAGTVVSVRGLVATLLAPTVGFWCRYVSKQTLAVLGLGCGAVGLALSPHVLVMPLLYVSPLLVGIGIGVSLPLLLSIIGEAAPDGQRGVALGLRGAVSGIGQTAAPLVAGPLLVGLGTVLGFGVAGAVAGTFLVVAQALYARSRAGADRPG